MDGAMQTIWHKAYQKALETITSLRNHCDFKYESDSKNAKEVKVLNAVRPTVKKYVPGTKIDRESISATDMTLKLDQYYYFNISIDDVVKAQTVPGAMEASAKEGSIALSEEGDKYVASVVKQGVTDEKITAVDSITPTKTNAIEHIESGFAVLYGNNCKVSENYWLEVDPTYFKFIRPSMTELLTNNVEMAKKGIVGKYGNANITIENLLPCDDTDVYNILRTEHAIAFAEQINKVEAYRPQDAFEDAIKGLYVFGALLARPEEIVVLKTAKKKSSIEASDPEITAVKVTNSKESYKEGGSEVEVGAVVATVAVTGGTEPFTYSVNGTDAASFEVDESGNVKTKSALTEKEYSATINVTDSKKKTGSGALSLTVSAAD